MSSVQAVKHILLVEGFGPLRQILAKNLEAPGQTRVTSLGNGQEAKDRLDLEQVDLLVCGMELPGLDGLALIRHLRQHPRQQGVPCLLLTAQAEKEAVLEAIEAGADELLIKPFNRRALEDKAQLLLGQNRQHRIDQGQEPAAGTPAARRPVILLVDDIALNLETVSANLHPDYQVWVATGGGKALEIAESDNPPDLILLDIMMPGMSGLEVCRRLKANPLTEAIPVIFLSAKGLVQDIVEGLEIGAVDYVTKPANPAILRARIQSQLRLRQARDRLQREIDEQVAHLHLLQGLEPGLAALAEAAADLAGDPDLPPALVPRAERLLAKGRDLAALLRDHG